MKKSSQVIDTQFVYTEFDRMNEPMMNESVPVIHRTVKI